MVACKNEPVLQTYYFQSWIDIPQAIDVDEFSSPFLVLSGKITNKIPL